MSSVLSAIKRCGNCDRCEECAAVRFCRNCGAVLPGLSQPQYAGRLFALLSQQISGSSRLPIPNRYSLTPSYNWDFPIAPSPVLTNAAHPAFPSAHRAHRLVDWGLFLLGPVGLLALLIGGVLAVAITHTNYVLLVALFLIIGRCALYGIKRCRDRGNDGE